MTWPTVKLGEITKIRTGKLDANAANENGAYPFFTCAVEPLSINTAAFDCKAILVAGNGDLNVKYYEGKFNAYQRTYVIESLDENKLLPKYLFLFLEKYVSRLRELAIGGVIKYIKIGNLTDAELPLPPLAEQQRIAAILDKAEEIKRKREQAVAKLDELAQSTFVEMFGDPVRNQKGWKTVELKQFGKIVTGNTPSRNDLRNYENGLIEWIKTDNITERSIFISPAREHLSQQGVKIGRTVKKGALLVACIAGSLDSIGRASLTDREVAFNQQINAIQPYEDINPLFLYNLFKSSRAYIQSHASSGMKKLLSKGEFEKIKMIKPPIALQNQFVATIEKVNYLRNQITAFDEQTNLLITSLQNQAFTTGFNA